MLSKVPFGIYCVTDDLCFLIFFTFVLSVSSKCSDVKSRFNYSLFVFGFLSLVSFSVVLLNVFLVCFSLL